MLFLGSQTTTSLAPHVRKLSCVLFVQERASSMIKIEGTKSPAERLLAISDDNSAETFLIGLIHVDDPSRVESDLGVRFARARGRWFHATPELVGFIQNNAQLALHQLLEGLRPHSHPSGTITIEEIAEHLDVSVSTVRRMVKAGKVPYLRAGNQLRFLAADVVASLQGG